MALRSVSIAFSRKQPYRSMNAGVFRFWGLQPLRLAMNLTPQASLDAHSISREVVSLRLFPPPDTPEQIAYAVT